MTQKEIAIRCLEKLNIYGPYVRKFKSKAGIPTFFENYAGFYADQEPELMNEIKKVEKDYGCLVYAVTHEFTDFGECWSMLCISQNPDSIEDFIDQINSQEFYTHAFVWNKSCPDFSEFGDIVVKSLYGGLKRVG